MTTLLPIAQLGDPVLRHVAQPIENLEDPWVQALIDNLLTTLREANGVGMAAPQVSNSHCVLVVASRPNARYPNAPEMEPTAMVNPIIISHSSDVVKDWEGCLSIPGIRGLVPRYREIEVEYISRGGHRHRQVLTDFVARIFQHEFDHLTGHVFLDRLDHVQDIMTDQEYLKRVVKTTA
jgi:peptide deformylase